MGQKRCAPAVGGSWGHMPNLTCKHIVEEVGAIGTNLLLGGKKWKILEHRIC